MFTSVNYNNDNSDNNQGLKLEFLCALQSKFCSVMKTQLCKEIEDCYRNHIHVIQKNTHFVQKIQSQCIAIIFIICIWIVYSFYWRSVFYSANHKIYVNFIRIFTINFKRENIIFFFLLEKFNHTLIFHITKKRLLENLETRIYLLF